jgi:uncharacterized membrane protein
VGVWTSTTLRCFTIEPWNVRGKGGGADDDARLRAGGLGGGMRKVGVVLLVGAEVNGALDLLDLEAATAGEEKGTSSVFRSPPPPSKIIACQIQLLNRFL